MTTTTATVAAAAPTSSTGTVTSFRRAAAAEWTRLWTVRTTWWALFATTALMALVTTTFVYEAIEETPADVTVTTVGQLGIAMAEYGLILIVMLAVTAEFSTGAIRASLQWVPRRGVLLAARTTVTVIVATVLGVVLVVASDLALWAVLRNTATVPRLTPAELAASAGSVAVVMAGSAFLTVGLAFALRHSAGTLTAVFLLLFVLPASLLEAGVDWLQALARALPGAAVVSLLDIGEMVSDTRAAVVLTAWSIAAMSLGTYAFLRRDA